MDKDASAVIAAFNLPDGCPYGGMGWFNVGTARLVYTTESQ